MKYHPQKVAANGFSHNVLIRTHGRFYVAVQAKLNIKGTGRLLHLYVKLKHLYMLCNNFLRRIVASSCD